MIFLGAMLPGDDVEAAVGYLTASFGSKSPAFETIELSVHYGGREE